MKALRSLLCALVSIATGGCVTQSAAWISASRFNYREYAKSQVAIMPVMLHRSVDEARFPAKEMQEAIATQLDVLEIRETQPMRADAAAQIPFPYTPQRLIEFGKEPHCEKDHRLQPCDAVVAATIIRMEERPSVRQWSFTGNITFVDVRNPERLWTIAKTWEMSGEVEGSKFQIASQLLSDFIQVRRILPRGVINKLLLRDTVVVDEGPILNFDIVDKVVDGQSNVTQALGIAADAKAGASHVLVDISAIDDEGVTSLRIVNKNAAFSTYVFGGPAAGQGTGMPVQQTTQQATKSEYYDFPRFIAERVLVKIAPGRNDITAIAVNGLGQESNGLVKLKVNVTKNAPAVAIVIATNGPGEGFEANGLRLVPKAAAEMQKLVDAQASTLPSGARAIMYVNDAAKRDDILYGVMSDWSVPGGGTRRVMAFIGRAEMFGGRPYLLLRDLNPKYPEIHSLSVNEFVELMRLGVSRASIDVCTDNSTPDAIETAIKEYVDLRIDVNVTAGCTHEIGKGFLDLAKDELFDD